MSELDRLKDTAWGAMMATARYPYVALQIGYLIDKATNAREVLLALAMIGEFEIEEESAREEAQLNAVRGR